VAGDIPELPPPPGGTAGIARARFASQHRRALWVVGFLSVTSIAILLAIISTAHQIGLLSRVHGGGIVTPSEAEASDARQLVTTLGYAGLLVVTGVVWMFWQHRAQSNLRDVGTGDLRFTPGWAVGWWFVPVASLWMPYLTVRELLRASEPSVRDWRQARTGSLPGLWWAAWIVASILTAIGRAYPDDTPGQFLASSRVFAVELIVLLVAGGLAIVLVRRIDGRQMALHRRLAATIGADQAPAAEPLPTGAPSSAALIVGAFLTVVAVIGAGIAYSDGRNPPGQAVGPRSSVGPATLATGWTEHDDPAGFSIGIPPDWKVRPNARCCALRADDRTGAIVAVITEPVPAGITLEQYADVLSGNIRVAEKVADDERTSLPAGPSIRLSLEGSANGLTIAEVVYVLIDGTTGYTVVFSTPRAARATMLPVFDEMIESLRFTA
jgi:Domain of unknown function (DUF4328)